MTRKYKIKKIFKFLLFSSIPALLFFGAAEIFCRVFRTSPASAHGRSGYVVPDPTLLWRLKRFDEGPFKTNSFGFRDNEVPAESVHAAD